MAPAGPWSSGFLPQELPRTTGDVVTLARCPGVVVPGARWGSPGSGRQAKAQGSEAGAGVRKRLGQLRCWSKMPSLETLVEEQMWQERTFLEPRLWVPGGGCCSGSQNMG